MSAQLALASIVEHRSESISTMEIAMGLRLMAVLAPALLLSSAAQAGVAEELTAAIKHCAVLVDDDIRHACYDRLPTLLKQQESAANASPAPANASPSPASASPAPASAAPADDDKGFFSDIFGSSSSEVADAEQIKATVESFTFDSGLFIVTLDNGQVWMQVAEIGDLVHLSREKKDKVTIWFSRFGYYVMKIEGFHTTYAVRRIN